MAYWKHYYTPDTVEQAVEILGRYDGRACMVGGGTDLLLEIQQGLHPRMDALVDPVRIADLGRITEENGHLVIGAGVTHTRIVSDVRLTKHAASLVESCGVIGGPQVRNVATLAGNIARALPAGDGTIGALALGAEIEVYDGNGARWLVMEDIFVGPGKSVVDPMRMIITRIRFRPTGAGEGSAFHRVMRPQGVALPMIGMAARVAVDNGHVTSARVAIGPAARIPFLARRTMECLQGKPVTDATFKAAAETALTEVTLRDSPHRASKAYREEMIMVQLPKTLARAAERAGTTIC